MKCLAYVLAFLVTCLTAWPVVVNGQSPAGRTRIDVSKLGAQVGERVPDFSLPDQNGRLRTLASIMGPRGALLMFIRSADWCPYCKTQLVDLQERAKELTAKGLGIAVISYDAPDVMAAFSRQRGITYPMLADVGSVTIKRYGILNTVAMQLSGPNAADPALAEDIKRYVSISGGNARMAGIAFPGTFILDRQGRVTSRVFEDFYVDRSTVSSVMVRAGLGAEVAGTRISTAHLDITVFSSDELLAAGNKVTLSLAISPKRNMHVYAPGAKGYRVIAATIEPHPHVRVSPVRYPPSEIYFFKPLDERVSVYQKPFSLMREIVLEGTPEAQAALSGMESLNVRGTLEYQACDDTVCFNPESVPLSWRFAMRPLVRERPVKQ
jgi:peroxiredoxin